MKQFIHKLICSIFSFLVGNIIIIIAAMLYPNPIDIRKEIIIETLVFLILQIFTMSIILIKPINNKKQRIILFTISELLTLFTIIFWGFTIVGPIWVQWGWKLYINFWAKILMTYHSDYKVPLQTRLIKEKPDRCDSYKETFRKRTVAPLLYHSHS